MLEVVVHSSLAKKAMARQDVFNIEKLLYRLRCCGVTSENRVNPSTIICGALAFCVSRCFPNDDGPRETGHRVIKEMMDQRDDGSKR
jgi:hypothetical protein